MMNVTALKARVRDLGGEVTDLGYVTHGYGNETAHVEVYFEGVGSGADSQVALEDGDEGVAELPDLSEFDNAENVDVDRVWDPEHNGVMFEVHY